MLKTCKKCKVTPNERKEWMRYILKCPKCGISTSARSRKGVYLRWNHYNRRVENGNH